MIKVGKSGLCARVTLCRQVYPHAYILAACSLTRCELVTLVYIRFILFCFAAELQNRSELLVVPNQAVLMLMVLPRQSMEVRQALDNMQRLKVS